MPKPLGSLVVGCLYSFSPDFPSLDRHYQVTAHTPVLIKCRWPFKGSSPDFSPLTRHYPAYAPTPRANYLSVASLNLSPPDFPFFYFHSPAYALTLGLSTCRSPFYGSSPDFPPLDGHYQAYAHTPGLISCLSSFTAPLPTSRL